MLKRATIPFSQRVLISTDDSRVKAMRLCEANIHSCHFMDENRHAEGLH